MQANWSKMLSGETIAFENGSWGQMIGKFPHLESLELELEATTAQESELKAIIAHAQKWRFPKSDTSRILTAVEAQTRWSHWQGPKRLNSYARRNEAEGPELVVAKVFYRASEKV